MAGDWIPVQVELPRKREVLAIVRLANLNRRFVVGAVIEFWGWVSTQTSDGHIAGVFLDQLPTLFPGIDSPFWDALVEVGWLEESRQGLFVPNAERWLSKGAKGRLQKNHRQATWRDRALPVVDTRPVDQLELPGGANSSLNEPRLMPDHIVQLWNTFASTRGLTRIELISPQKRLRRMVEVLKDHPAIEWWQTLLDEIDRSPFLLGKVRTWAVKFDWLLDPDNLCKVVEGTYRNAEGEGTKKNEHNQAPSAGKPSKQGAQPSGGDRYAADRAIAEAQATDGASAGDTEIDPFGVRAIG